MSQVEQNNVIIAQFIGCKLSPSGLVVIHPTDDDLCIRISKLAYHKDWNVLMPVVNHIQTIDKGRFYLHTDPWSIEVYDYINSPEVVILNMEFERETDLISRYYETVLSFIKWYNKNTD